jgi:dienelactone hydrolase
LRLLLTLASTLVLASADATAQAPARIPLEHYFDNPASNGAALSPSGRFLASVVSHKGQRDILAVVDLETMKATVVADFRNGDVGHVQWVNDQRLLFNTTDNLVPIGERSTGPGLFAVNRDGSAMLQLADRRHRSYGERSALPYYTYMHNQPGAQDSDWVYVAVSPVYDDKRSSTVLMAHLNTVNGKVEYVDAPPQPNGWKLDYQGKPALASGGTDTDLVQYVQQDDKSWKQLVSTNALDDSGGFEPLALAAGNILYVNASLKDKNAVHTYDLATGKLSAEALIELEGYDFDGELILQEGKLVGMRYLAEGVGNLWFAPQQQSVQAAIDVRLPGLINLLTFPQRPTTPFVLVNSYSDRQPHLYHVYNRDTHQLLKVGEQYPNIVAAQQAHQKMVRYKARDGADIPALLTLPVGQSTDSRSPMVVLVHGGPYVRGSTWGWSNESQFLASRGYVVLEPYFRGGTGFGTAHYKAGWKQWGLKMQDDVADGARWAIEQGYAAAHRICIAGSSYGGYAALMGVLNDHDLYQCAINAAGVTDIELMYKGHWYYTSDLSEWWKQHGMPNVVGDLQQDAAQLKATSPLQQAVRIRRPLLLAYGDSDHRVPLVHGTRFRDAVKATNKNVEWVEYDDEGHTLLLPKNRIDFWQRVEKFLDKHIGAGAKTE